VILAVLTGLAAHGWNVYAQKTIPIGTIGVAQVAQPALAVVWAFILLGEELGWRQALGMGIVTVGLLVFILLNERGTNARDEQQDSEITLAGEGSGAVL
jgi:drug/metabolite transporter (DMT)-like permease